jgi:hypothetical protein
MFVSAILNPGIGADSLPLTELPAAQGHKAIAPQPVSPE